MKKIILTSLGEFVLSVTVSIIVVALLQRYLTLRTYEAIVLGMIGFIALWIIRIGYVTLRSYSSIDNLNEQMQRLPDKKDIQKLEKTNREIEQITTRMRQISDGLKIIATKYPDENNLFPQWYRDKLDTLFQHIQNTIDEESFFFDSSLLQQLDKIYDVAFQGRDGDHFLATTSCEDISWFLNPIGDVFLRTDDEKFRNGLIKSIRRIFTYNSEDELQRFRVKLCFLLHQQSQYEYKVIKKTDFDIIFVNFMSRALMSDFGIYGDHFLWEASPEQPRAFEFGYFCINKNRIEKYKRLFEKLWLASTPYNINDPELREYSRYRMSDFRSLMLSRE